MFGELIILTLVDLILFLLLILAITWDQLCNFFHTHYTYFKILFVVIYSLEQAIFTGSSYFNHEISQVYPVIVGLFALVVLTTVTLQGIMMESINKKSSDKLNEYNEDYSKNFFKMKQKFDHQIANLGGYIYHLEKENNLIRNLIFNNQKASSKK